MKTTDHPSEIFLHQGDVYFGAREARIRTVLGSCVAVTMWHPHLLIGGMCHYMLPSRHKVLKEALDGKYADEALDLMFSEIHRSSTRPEEYQIKLFGGGNVFPASDKLHELHVGLRNVEAGRELLARRGLRVHAEHLGMMGHRNLIFDIRNGHVWMKHQTPSHSPCDNREMKEACLHA